jgi:hypothetical protein
MNKHYLAASACALLCACATETESTSPGDEEPWQTPPYILSGGCQGCLLDANGGACADELAACAWDDGCYSYMRALSYCTVRAGLWSEAEVQSCRDGAKAATPAASVALAETFYCCAWEGAGHVDFVVCSVNICTDVDKQVMDGAYGPEPAWGCPAQ